MMTTSLAASSIAGKTASRVVQEVLEVFLLSSEETMMIFLREASEAQLFLLPVLEEAEVLQSP